MNGAVCFHSVIKVWNTIHVPIKTILLIGVPPSMITTMDQNLWNVQVSQLKTLNNSSFYLVMLNAGVTKASTNLRNTNRGAEIKAEKTVSFYFSNFSKHTTKSGLYNISFLDILLLRFFELYITNNCIFANLLLLLLLNSVYLLNFRCRVL